MFSLFTKRCFVAAFLTVGLLSLSNAQESSAVGESFDASKFMGSFITSMPFRVAFTRGLYSNNAKVGDKVELRYFGEVRDGSGKVLIGKNARFFGLVTEAMKRDKQHAEARLAIRIDHVEDNGKVTPISLAFCGGFVGRPVLVKSGSTTYPTYKLTSGLPADAKFLPDASVGPILASQTDNISVEPETLFSVCELRPPPEVRAAPVREMVVPDSLPAGVRIAVVLKTALDTTKVKRGEAVEMSLTQDLIGPGNTIAMPKGAMIKGQVLVADAGSKAATSKLAIVAESASWPGHSVPLHAFAEKPPVLGTELLTQMLSHRSDASLDLRGITVEPLPETGSAFVRTKHPIKLPIGTVLFLRQSE